MARKAKDLALVYGSAEDGDGLKIVRQRRGSSDLEAGMLRPLRSGRAISGEVVHLEPRRESPLLFDVETDAELSAAGSGGATEARTDRAGPPQVASDDYRRGWDAIWGGRGKAGPVSGPVPGSRSRSGSGSGSGSLN
jgi:hypothetical protein